MNTLTDARLQLLRRRISELPGGLGASASVTAVETAPVPEGQLYGAERRMWKIYELDPESASHNIALVIDLAGDYSVESVAASIEQLVRKAPVLGSLVAVDADGVPSRTPIERAGEWTVPGAVWQWGSFPAGIPAATVTDGRADRAGIDAAASALSRASFELTVEAPIRLRVHATGDGAVTVVLVVHHLAVDDTSWPLVLGTLISGAVPELPARTGRPGVVSQDLVDRALAHARQTWAAEDVRYPLSGELPADSPEQSWLSPMVESRGERRYDPVDPAAIAALDGVSAEAGATLNALLVAVCSLTVYTLTGAADHVLLVPTDNRRPGEEPDRVGYRGNIVPMRFTFDPEASVRDSLRAAAASVYRSMDFATVDYGAVLTALRTSGGRFPVAEILASVRNAPLRGIPVPEGVRVDCASVFNGIGNYPLTLAFEIEADDTVHLEVDHQPDIVGAETARRAAEIATALVARIPTALDTPLASLVRAVGEPVTT